MARRRAIPSWASMRRSRSASITRRLSSRRAIISRQVDDEGIEGLFEARLLDRDRFGQLPPPCRQRLETRLFGVRKGAQLGSHCMSKARNQACVSLSVFAIRPSASRNALMRRGLTTKTRKSASISAATIFRA